MGQLIFVYLPSSVFISLSVYPHLLFLAISLFVAKCLFLTIEDFNKPFTEQVIIIIVISFLVDWKTELLEYVDEGNLPQYYGGTCRDPDRDPLCRSKVF